MEAITVGEQQDSVVWWCSQRRWGSGSRATHGGGLNDNGGMKRIGGVERGKAAEHSGETEYDGGAERAMGPSAHTRQIKAAAGGEITMAALIESARWPLWAW